MNSTRFGFIFETICIYCWDDSDSIPTHSLFIIIRLVFCYPIRKEEEEVKESVRKGYFPKCISHGKCA